MDKRKKEKKVIVRYSELDLKAIEYIREILGKEIDEEEKGEKKANEILEKADRRMFFNNNA